LNDIADINAIHIYVEIDMKMKHGMIERAGAPALIEAHPWKKPDILTWLNRLAGISELCIAKQSRNPGNPRICAKRMPNFT
jgi:hypothetical protein